MKLSLDGVWDYLVDEEGEFASDALPEVPWGKMSIPSNWQLGGLEDYSGVVWFRRRFNLTKEEGREYWLRFHGIDYFAKVWLNGAYLGEHEGYFQPFEFNVTKAMKSGENELLVRVDSPMEVPEEAWPDRKRLIKGVFNHHDCRPGAWDPAHGQDKNTGGIWNSVLIYKTADIRVGTLRVAPLLFDDGTAALTVKAILENYGKEPTTARVRLEIQPYNFAGEPLTREWEQLLPPGRTEVQRVVQVKNPKLWWTWEHGEQNLYRAELRLTKDGEMLDARKERFGIREITVDKEHGWQLNGRRFFPRGTNVIPAQWLSGYDEAKIAKDIKLLRDANINAVRVHAHVTRPEFYDACDEAGILVWQDFPLQWSYEKSEEFYNEAAKQLREMIEFLYNHPSIGVWCCHNEPSINKGRLDHVLYQVARESDPSRYVEHHSDFRDHPYPGWYYGHWSLFAYAPGAPFVNEFGAQALPSLESMRKILHEKKLWPPDWEAWAYHDFQYDQTFRVAQIEMGDSLEGLIQNSQEYQYRLLKFAIESYRRDRRMTGLFQFMFMDPWPAITWSVVDYWRQPKRGYRALQMALQPVLVVFTYGQDRFEQGSRKASLFHEITIVNDLNQAFFGAELQLLLEGPQGELVTEEAHAVNVPPTGMVRVITPKMREGRWRIPKEATPGRYILQARLSNGDRVISKNEAVFTVVSRETESRS